MIKAVLKSLLSLSLVGLAACKGKPKANLNPPKGEVTEALVSDNWEGLIADARRFADIPAVGGVVMRNGVILDQGFDGKKNYFAADEVMSSDAWHVGSITKSMTATMIARLVERGTLTWDDTIGDVFGTDETHVNWHDVSLKALLTHTSGADVNFPKLTMLKYPKTEEEIRFTRKTAVAKILAKGTTGKSTFVYSNVGFTIAGHIAELKTGKSWESLMQEEVFGPLDLRSAGFGAPLPKDGIAPIQGHRGKLSIEPSSMADNTPIIGPAGTVHMSLQDLAKFGQIHLNGLKGEAGYLKKETFEILHSANLNNYAMGWIEAEPKTLPVSSIFWHNGSNTMWYALLVAVPDENIVYALATNTGDVATVDPVFNALIRLHLTELKEMEIE